MSVSVPRTRLSPQAVVFAGCAIALISFGPRAAAGLFQVPMTSEYGWGRDVFGLALAIQNLCWGMGQPFAGAIADRFGAVRVFCAGGLLYALGLVLMSYGTTPVLVHLGAGVLVGFGLSGCSGNLVISVFGKLLPESWRPMAFGASTAAGSLGQFLFLPTASVLIDTVGWHQTLVGFAVIVLVILPLSLALATPRAEAKAATGPAQSIPQALAEAFRHRSYVLLVLGFFTCGFQLAFITVHLPAYLKDGGLSTAVGGWTLAAIGLCNAVGSLGAGWLTGRMSRRWLLAWIYLGRSLAITVFILLPLTPVTAIGFGAAMGFLWLSTVPPTSALVMLMFGTRYMAMLFGFAFFSHQVGGFLGVYLGGVLYEMNGSYDLVWWLSVALGLASAAINLPIREERVVREPALASAA
ncbi:MAG TPA: MFS transporter [Beijerinckiaceae bacterium]|jgi:MFS family permease|nr:MFS transporter [Beijerinckiaceae bacterium]